LKFAKLAVIVTDNDGLFMHVFCHANFKNMTAVLSEFVILELAQGWLYPLPSFSNCCKIKSATKKHENESIKAKI